MNTFGERLRYYRLAAGLTQEELAQKCGMKKQSISRYEKSDREPNIHIAKAIADALGISLETLASGKKYTELIDKVDLQFFGNDSSPVMTEDEYDEELREVLEEMKNRPDMRMLFRLAKGAKAEDVRAAVKIIEALREK